MTLRKSETVLRLMVALALGFGFLGFATHSPTVQADQMAHVELTQLPTAEL